MAEWIGQPFDELLASGIAAYKEFHADVTSAGGASLKIARAQSGPPGRLIASLPEVAPELPLRVIASLGWAAVEGALQLAPGDASSGRGLPRWYKANADALELCVPEARGATLWPGWRKPSGQIGRSTIDGGWSTLEAFAGALVEAEPSIRLEDAAFCVLVRDWFHDLTLLLAGLGVDASALVARAFVLFRNYHSNAPLTAIKDMEQRARAEIGTATSPWTLFAAFALDDGPLSLLNPALGIGRVTAVARTLVSALEASTAGEEPPQRQQAEPLVGPSTTITSDAWTIDDRLDYAVYAEAIARFIVDERTRAPLTIGIKAPWGAGKTSLMRMVRCWLDPEVDADAQPTPSGREDAAGAERSTVSNGEVLASTKRSPQEAAEHFAIRPLQLSARRTTVWFNAWKYESARQLWAGLAHAIVSQVEQRMTLGERERFWASLNIRRLDMTTLRRRIYTGFLVRAVPDLVALALVGVAAPLLWAVVSAVVGKAALVGGLPLALGDLFRRWTSFAKQDVSAAIPKLVADPGYEDQLGFLHLVHEDMERILRLVASRERPLVVFVDDLDRCSYTTVTQVIEALNVFLASDFDNCIFVIAMEPDLVAAQIHVAHAALFRRIRARDGADSDLGWRFLEKMVQLPLALPPPDGRQLERFADSLVTVTGAATEDCLDDDDDDEVRHAHRLIREAREDDSLSDIIPAMQRVQQAAADPGTPERSVPAGALRRAAQLEFAAELDDDHPEVRALVRRHIDGLARNPREVKRFVNLFRFYAYVQFSRQAADLPSPGLDGAAKLARIAVRCPDLLTPLAATVSWGRAERTAFEWLEREDSDQELDAGLRDALSERLQAALAASDDVHDLIRSPPLLGVASRGFL